MFDRTLLERLDVAGGPVGYGPATGTSLHASVLASLRRILNDRQACCETRPDYGMPDLNTLMGRGTDSLLEVARAVRYQVENFEPRLRDVQVVPRLDPDQPMAMSFHIQAVLQAGDEMERVSFDSVLSGDKRVEVRG